MTLFGNIPMGGFVLALAGIIYFSMPSNSLMGLIYFNSYRYDEAFEYLSRVEEDDLRSIEVLKKLKEYFLIHGDVVKPLEIQKKLVGLKPKNPAFLIELEKLYDWNLDPYMKLRTMERRLSFVKDPLVREKMILEIGNGYRWIRKYEDAERIFMNVESSEDPAVKKQVISYYLASGQVDEAEKKIQSFLDSFGYNAELIEFLADIYRLRKDYKKAAIQYLILIGEDLEFGRYFKKIGFVKVLGPEKMIVKSDYIEDLMDLYRLLEYKSHVIELLEVKLQFDSENVDLIYELAESHYKNNSLKNAYRFFRKFENKIKYLESDYEDLLNYYEILKKKKDWVRVLKTLANKSGKREYWERLAEHYENSGQKRKALKIYLKLLKKKKGRRRSEIFNVLIKGELLASNTLQGQRRRSGISKIKSLKKNSVERVEIQHVNLSPTDVLPVLSKQESGQKKFYQSKVLQLLGELKDYPEKIKVLKGMINDSPNDITLRKELAYTYYNMGENKKAQDVIYQVHFIDPNDQEGLEVAMNRDAQAKKYKFALVKMERLEKMLISARKPVPNYFNGMKEEFLHQLKDEKGYKNQCKKIYKRFNRREFSSLSNTFRCLSREKKSRKVLALGKVIMDAYPKKVDFQNEMIYVALETGKLKIARQVLGHIKKNKLWSKTNDQQMKYLRQIVGQEDYINRFVASYDFRFYETKAYGYLNPQIDIQQRVDQFGFGLEVNHIDLKKDGNKSFSSISPYLAYSKDKFYHSLGYAIGLGDKDLDFPVWYKGHWAENKSYIGWVVENSGFEFGSSILGNKKKGRRKLVEVYSEFSPSSRNDLWTNSLGFKRYEVDNGKGDHLYFSSEYLFALTEYPHQLRIGPTLFYSKLNSNDLQIKNLFVNKSFSYGLTVDYTNRWKLRKKKEVLWRIKGTIGGDDERNIDLGNQWEIYSEIMYLYRLDKSVKIYGEHFNEADQFTQGSSTIIGISGTHWF